MSPRPGLIIVCVYVWEEKEEILIIERVEMIVDDDEVGSKRLISYKIYGCQENRAEFQQQPHHFPMHFPFHRRLENSRGNQH